PDQRQLARLKKGVHLAEGYARAQSIVIKKKHGQSTELVIVLNEGRNREIRRILARVGHKVLTLKRIAVGPIKLGDLPLGNSRRLMPDEVEALLRVAQEKRRAGKASKVAKRVQDSGFRVQESEQEATPYLQKQALLAEPLSLEDLLRDDLDEGPITPEEPNQSEIEQSAETKRGGVIDYEA